MEHPPKYQAKVRVRYKWTVRIAGTRPLTTTGNGRLSQTTKTVNLREFTP